MGEKSSRSYAICIAVFFYIIMVTKLDFKTISAGNAVTSYPMFTRDTGEILITYGFVWFW